MRSLMAHMKKNTNNQNRPEGNAHYVTEVTNRIGRLLRKLNIKNDIQTY